MKLIKKENYKVMPWKNGQGITSEIALFPENASFPDSDFQWRLSSAIVKTASSFSLFANCDRWLTILQGDGLLLNGSRLEQHKMMNFSGEIPIQCKLLGEEVVDLGVIYRRDKFSAAMSFESISAAKTLFYDRGTHLIYCTDGELTINALTAQAGDSFVIEGPFEVNLHPKTQAHYFHVILTV